MTRPGIEPMSPGPLANTITLMPIIERNLINKGNIFWTQVNSFYYLCIRIIAIFTTFRTRLSYSEVSWPTRELTRNFEQNSLFNRRGYIVLIPLTITGNKCWAIESIPCYFELLSGLNQQTSDDSLSTFSNKMFIPVTLYVVQDNSL